MTRLIIKNLHESVTAEKLKTKFSEKGVVTDVQLKYTKDGKFRGFAFIGFKSDEEANSAIQYFDKTYLNSSRITVEKCSQLGDPTKPKSWSKYAADSSVSKKIRGTEKSKPIKHHDETEKLENLDPVTRQLIEKVEKYKDDPAFLEFLEAHDINKKAWQNGNVQTFLEKYVQTKNKVLEDTGAVSDNEGNENDETEEKKIAEDETISDAEYLKLKTGKKTIEEVEPKHEKQIYHSLVMRGLPFKVKKRMIKDFFKPLKVDSIRIPTKIKGVAYIGFKTENSMKKALIRNKSFIDGKQVFIYPVTNNENLHSVEKNVGINEKWKKQEDSLQNEEDVAESGRIFVRNLSYTTSEKELQEVFEKYGPVSEVIIPIDKITRKIKGFGIITYLIPEHAIKAFNELDGSIFQGRMLHLLPGKAKTNEEINVKEGSSFKTKKIQKLKAEAGSSHNWNTLFLGQNAVADLMASNYKVSKEEMLSGDNAAVRLALGETELVNETKDFLEQSGVKLDAFNRTTNHRSKTVILAKNLPAGTTVEEIRNLFSKHGVLGRILLPPSGITAIIEFIEPAEARTAFRRLAYSKFKNLPLYLEWAPEDTFTSSFKAEVNKTVKENNVKNHKITEDENEVPEEDTTLFIKNLNFETKESDVRKHFENCGRIADVTIAKKKDPEKSNELLSMGYGFIQFYKKQSVQVALKTLQQSSLHEHCLELKRSNRTLKTEAHISRKENNVEKQTSSKILVRNIPFQAKHSELMELFKAFGDIKALRLPKKMVGSGPHRGFAFVEYHTKQEAKKAMETLCQSTHLYGRRLVLEWAQTSEEDIEQVRKRTADHFSKEKEIRSKKSVFEMNPEKKDEDDE